MKCKVCFHFSITWDAAAPYGCGAWGIKTRLHPHWAVYASSGLECQLFRPREKHSDKHDGESFRKN
jgi:hypothetical protein